MKLSKNGNFKSSGRLIFLLFLIACFAALSAAAAGAATALKMPAAASAADNGPKVGYNPLDDTSSPTLEKARQLQNDGFHEKAVAMYRAFVQQHPESEEAPAVLIEIGKCQRELYEKSKLLMLDNVIKSYEEMASRYPQSEFAAQSYYQIGQIYEKDLKEYREAIKYYEKCAYDFPTTQYAASAYYRMGQVYENNLDDYEGAILAYQRLARDFGKYQIAVDALVRVQKIYELKTKEPNKVAETYGEIMNNYGENKKMPEILMDMARYYKGRNDNENAIKTYQQLVEKFPKDKNAVDAYKEMASIYEESKEYKNLAQLYQKFYENYQTYEKADQVLFKIGQIYEINLREYKKKRIDEKTYFKLDDKNLEEAIKYYTKIVDNYPQSSYAPTALLRIADILNNDLYKGVEAKFMYKAIVEKYPQSKEFAQATTVYEKMR